MTKSKITQKNKNKIIVKCFKDIETLHKESEIFSFKRSL